MTDVVVARRTLNRAAVVRAAADLADRNGLDELTLTRVADSLGVSLPALYNHVRSTADCTAAIAQLGVDSLTSRLDRARCPDPGFLLSGVPDQRNHGDLHGP